MVIQDVRGQRDKKQNGIGISDGSMYTVDATSQHGVHIPAAPMIQKTTHALTSEGHDASEDGTGRGTPVLPDPVKAGSVRRLTCCEVERLQGFPCGWTCLCDTTPLCPERRVPEWVDAKTFTLGGCGHSACGCTCPDSPRYRVMGNAVAVPVVRWLADRCALVMTRQKA